MRTAKQIALTKALLGSSMASARLAGMKIRAQCEPPTACVGTFPFGPSRTCAEWQVLSNGTVIDREMTDEERERDAIEGSAKLKAAIERLAA
jgi:hypothetical protein